ncbi:MAG: hypothetical protein Q8N09_11545 [Thermodesulfovibrionia bacterium]|nr:hypothetical protein [Thermodesulfovibrionia bacterium]
MPTESTSIQAIQLVRRVFEHVHGNLGVLRFNVEELTPTNGTATEESKKWDVVFSFYETLGSTSPSQYKASVDLITNTISFKKISRPDDGQPEKLTGSYIIKKTEAEDKNTETEGNK